MKEYHTGYGLKMWGPGIFRICHSIAESDASEFDRPPASELQRALEFRRLRTSRFPKMRLVSDSKRTPGKVISQGCPFSTLPRVLNSGGPLADRNFDVPTKKRVPTACVPAQSGKLGP